MKQALLECKNKYQRLLNSIDSGFCIIEMIYDAENRPIDYRILETNPAFENQTGIHDATGKRIREIKPEHEDKWSEIYDRVAQTGKPVRFERESKGFGRWYDVFAFKMGENHDQRVGILFTDITEQKQSKERQAFLLKLSDALRPLSDAQSIQDTATSLLTEHLGASQTSYSEYREDSIVIHSEKLKDRTMKLTGEHKKSDFPGCISIMRKGKDLIIPDVLSFSGYSHKERSRLLALNIRSSISVPLVKEGKLVAVLSVRQSTPRAWSPTEVELVRETAEHTWAAVERAQAEEALLKSERKYRELFESINEAYCIIEMIFDENSKPVDFLFLETNPAFEKHASRSMLGKRIKEMIPEFEQFWLDQYGQVSLTGQPVELEHIVSGLGDQWFHSSAFKIGSQDSKKVGVLFENITERKQTEYALQKAHDELEQKVAERTAKLTQANTLLQQEINHREYAQKALQVSEARYRLLVENANEAIIVLQDGIIKYANPRAEEIFACPAVKLHSVLFIDFVHPEDRKSILEHPYKQDNPFNYKIVDHNGNMKYIMENSVEIEWEGHPAILALLTDMTEVKKMEEEIIRADKIEAVGILAGGIAHDFNNYLTILLSNIYLTKQYSINHDLPKILEKLEELEEATLRAKDLSNHLFTFAQGGDPVKERISMRKLIIDDIKFALSGTAVLPHFSLVEDLSLVEADATQMSQVLNNIAINAVQAMPEGGVLKVQGENILLESAEDKPSVPLPEGPYIKITICDEGTGIPDKFLKKIFDPFFTTKDKGRGFGLATSYSIIKKHGGYISVESEMGIGTSFTIFLPAAVGTVRHQSASAHMAKGTGKILFMDDEEELVTAIGESLSALGYDITLSRDGKEAINLYTHALEKDQPFDLVILDLTIPGGIGGKQTIKELLKLDPDVKAIVASGYSNDPNMAMYSDFGFKGMIKKPFTIDELSKTLNRVMNS